MADFGEGNFVKGRKLHRCDGCLGPIPLGEKHFNYRGIYDGDWQNWRMHQECFDALDADSDYGYEFTPGDYPMPERVRAALERHLADEKKPLRAPDAWTEPAPRVGQK